MNLYPHCFRIAGMLAGLHFSLAAAEAAQTLPAAGSAPRHEASQRLNEGTEAYGQGWFSRCLQKWPQAWVAGKDAAEGNVREEAERAFAEWMRMLSRLGGVEDLRAGLESVEGRVFRGTTAEMVQVARDALWVMEHQPGVSFRCGPAALQRILMHSGAADMWPAEIIASQSPPEGFSLTEVAALSARIGMHYQMARRVAAEAEIPVPAVVHWKLDHYGAVVRKDGARYLLDDPTFGNGLLWIDEEALQNESSGYFLLPPGPLPAGWEAIGDPEGARVFGRGYTNSDQPGSSGPGNPKGRGGHPPGPPPNPPPGDPGDDDCGGGAPEDNRTPNDGMAGWDVSLMMASLEISDVPVGYRPPVGPAIFFQVRYHQRETNQPAVLDYANFGRLWNCDWIGSLTFDTATAYYHRGQGGTETFTGFDAATQSYAPGYLLANELVKTGATRYELRRPDGGKIVFALPDAAGTRIFMTQVVDPQGNAAALTYDAAFRLTGVTDARGLTSVLAYGTAAESLLVKRITDPYGRFATFDYDASGRLIRITDVVGLTSEFTYGAGDVMQTLTTGYGTTSFSIGSVNAQRFVEVTHPNGEKERFEQRNGGTAGVAFSEPAALVPKGGTWFNSYLDGRNTFYWDRKAMKEAPGDYSRARMYHFMHHDLSTRSPILESYQVPGENRVWLNYQGQNSSGFFNQGLRGHAPARRARVLGDGRTQSWLSTYNAAGRVLTETDPLGRELRYTYAANGVDLVEVRRKTGAADSVRLEATTYDARHLPLTVTDAAGQTTTFTWNAGGQLQSLTNALGQSAVFTYDALGCHTGTDGPLPGAADTWAFTYDSMERVRTETGPDGYTRTYTRDGLDRLTRITFPDGTFQEMTFELLHPVASRDRRGRVTSFTFDALQRQTSATDPAGRTVRYEWDPGGDLRAIIDALGRRTEWQYDFDGKVVRKLYHDGTAESFQYDDAGRLAVLTGAKGQRKIFRYAADDADLGWSYENTAVPTPAVAYTWDEWFPRVVTRTDGAGVTRHAYHPIAFAPGAGLLASIDGPLAGDTITFNYDAVGRVTSRSIGGAVESQAYDAAGRILTGTNALGTFTNTWIGATDRVASYTLPNGQSAEFDYFPGTGDFRLREIRHLRPGGAPLLQCEYTYDAEGGIATFSRQRDSGAARVWTYGYDLADRLTGSTATNPAVTAAWTYDAAGNRLTETLNSVTTTASYNARDMLTGTDPSTQSDRTYEWDAENRLMAINYAGTALRTEFSYDGLDRRVGIVEKNGATVTSERRFLWCGGQICQERNADSSVAVQFFARGMKIVAGAQAGDYFYAGDHLDSIHELTDATGTPRQRLDFDPWGRVTEVAGDVSGRFAYAGLLAHAPSGLHLAQYRAYAPGSGRWTSPDPLTDSERLPEGPHRFAYAGNDPVNFADPDGLSPGGKNARAQGNNNGGRGAFGKNSSAGKGTTGKTRNGDFLPRTATGGRAPSGQSGGALPPVKMGGNAGGGGQAAGTGTRGGTGTGTGSRGGLPATTVGGYVPGSSGRGAGGTTGGTSSGATGTGGQSGSGTSGGRGGLPATGYGGHAGTGGMGAGDGSSRGMTGGGHSGGGYGSGGYSGGGQSSGGNSSGGSGSGGTSRFGGWH